MGDEDIKPVVWIGSSYRDFRAFPEAVQDGLGYALFRAQQGEKHESAKPLKGFGGAGVVEIVEDHNTDTYRAIYTVKLRGTVYVLHVFQKKSKKGIKTPGTEMDVVRRRLKVAEEDYKQSKGSAG